MLKISIIKDELSGTILRLEGRVAGPWVIELKDFCDKFLNENNSITLDLAEVSYVDQTGVFALANLQSRGVSFANPSPFVIEQLKMNGG